MSYNKRREDLSKENLLKRGYDHNGWPFAPCGLLCRPNGFDEKRGRLSFCCFKQCLRLKLMALKDLSSGYDMHSCPGLKNHSGFVRHMYTEEHPRLITEIPRGSKLFKEAKKIRSASERSNSSLKEDIGILDRPRVLNAKRASCLAQLAGIVLLLKRVFSFVVRVTIQMRRFSQDNDPYLIKRLLLKNIPAFIRNLFQLE